MSHEVETMFARTTPWHELGNVTGRNLTAKQAIEAAELDWIVEKQPIYAQVPVTADMGDGFTIDTMDLVEIPDKRATVRSSDGSVLGVVGDTYEPIQNEQMFEWAEMLLDTGEAQFVSAGSLREGKIVFATLELGDDIDLAGGPYRVKPYFTTASSHDGSIAFKAFTSPTLVVCMNTLTAAMSHTISSWTIRHTSSADFRLDQARRLLGVVYNTYDNFNQQAQKLLNTTHTELQFEELVPSLLKMPKDPTPRVEQNVKAERSKVRRIYNSDTIKPFRGTAWGSLNAFNEYELWEKRVRGSRAERHALRAINNDFPLTEKARKALVGVA